MPTTQWIGFAAEMVVLTGGLIAISVWMGKRLDDFQRSMDRRFGEVRDEITQLRGEMRSEIGPVRGEMRSDTGLVRDESREAHAAIGQNIRDVERRIGYRFDDMGKRFDDVAARFNDMGKRTVSGVNHGRESSNYLQGRMICAFCPRTATAAVVQKQRQNRLKSREFACRLERPRKPREDASHVRVTDGRPARAALEDPTPAPPFPAPSGCSA